MSEYRRKSIDTYLTVKLMPGKTVKDVWRDFFKGKLLPEFSQKEVITRVELRGINIPYEAYKLFAGYGATADFLEMFDINYKTLNKQIDGYKLKTEVNKVIPFTTRNGIYSELSGYNLTIVNYESENEFRIKIETHTYNEEAHEIQIKEINKENARKLRKYLVGLPSVQGVPYTCQYQDNMQTSHECEIGENH